MDAGKIDIGHLKQAAPKGIDEATAQLLLNLLNVEDFKSLLSLSDLTPREIFRMTLFLYLAEIFDMEELKASIENFLRARNSLLRKGRKELISALLGYMYGKSSRSSGKLSDLLE